VISKCIIWFYKLPVICIEGHVSKKYILVMNHNQIKLQFSSEVWMFRILIHFNVHVFFDIVTYL
jgi:hypothetical protein